MISRRKFASVAFTAVLVSGAGIGSAGAAMGVGAPVSAAVPAMSTQQMAISIDDFAYAGPGTVSPGAVIAVTNNDSEVHTVTATDGSFDLTIPGGASATFTAPSEAGTYDFICKFHGNMKGSLTVATDEMAPSPAMPAPAPTVAEIGGAASNGMDQMGAVPEGGADTGVLSETRDGQAGTIALAGGLFLVAAAGGSYAVRRRNS